MIEVSEAVVRTTAEICGPHSGAAKALANAQKRRARGEQVTFYKVWNAIVVHGAGAAPAHPGERKEGKGD